MKKIRLLLTCLTIALGIGLGHAQTLYWTVDATGETGTIPFIDDADGANTSTNYTDWVNYAGNAANQQIAYANNERHRLAGYPNSVGGQVFRLSPWNGTENKTNNIEYARRIGNTTGAQTLYLAMVASVVTLTPQTSSFPLGFAAYGGGAAATRTWGPRLLINNKDGVNGNSANYEFGIVKDNDAGNRIFSTEKTYIADGGGAGTSAVFVVMKLTMDGDNTNGNDVFQLFTSTSFPIEEPATWDLTTTTGADIDVNSVFLREKMDFNGGPQDHNFDFNDMRVADSWDALFPTTTYAGSAWSSGNPNSSTSAKVNSNLSLASDLVVNNLEISAGVSVTIAAGQTLDVKGNISGSGNLVVESGGSLLVYDGNTLGSVTVKRNSSFEDAANRYSFIGSPVAGFDIAGLNSGFHYTYNTSDDTYTAASGVMTPGVGYTSAGKKALEFVGTPNVGTINVTLDNTGDQFNFISNPYTSAISRSSFVTANSNIDGSIYLWDDGGSNVGKRTNADFITVTNAGATGGSNGSGATFDENTAIGSAQGFLVKGSAAGDVTFTEAMRVMDNNADGNFFRLDNELYKFKLNVAGSGNHDQTLIAFTNQATDGFDRSWDATKMLLGGSLGLYTKMEESKLAVQALPLIEGSIDILLGLQVMHDDAYVLSLEDVNIPTSYTITLIDNKTNEIVNLIDGEVTLSLSSSDQDRFTLRVSSVSDVLSIDDLSKRLKAYMSENQLNIESPSIKGEAFLTVFDFGGRIYTKSNVSFDENGRSNINAAFLKSGIYIVKIQKGKSIQTTKIIINN